MELFKLTDCSHFTEGKVFFTYKVDNLKRFLDSSLCIMIHCKKCFSYGGIAWDALATQTLQQALLCISEQA